MAFREEAAEALAKLRNSVGSPGASVGLSAGGERLIVTSGLADHRRQWPLCEGSRYAIGCISKLLLGIVVSKLSDDGVLDLRQPLDDWAHRLFGRSTGRGILLEHLLSHSAGFQGPLMYGRSHSEFTWEEFRDYFSVCEQTFAAGTVFNYENTGHLLVREICQLATGKPITELMRSYIFDPLGIRIVSPLETYNATLEYVAPHQIIAPGGFRTVLPTPFGAFWRGSLSDLALTVDDFLTIGEAILGLNPSVDFRRFRDLMRKGIVVVPCCVSGRFREHSPRSFSVTCAQYNADWFGYAGSALGLTCGLRFNAQSRQVVVVCLNAWLPVARDMLLDRFCQTITHPEAGLPGGNETFGLESLPGVYRGGGNIIRSVSVRHEGDAVVFQFSDEGVQPGPISLCVDESGMMIPDGTVQLPPIGFFPDPETNRPCLMVGMSALKMVH